MRDDEATREVEAQEFSRASVPLALSYLERVAPEEARGIRELHADFERRAGVAEQELARLEAEVEVLGRAALMPWPPDPEKNQEPCR